MNSSTPLSVQIQNAVSPYLMLSHPFYQAWMQGTLPLTSLQNYSVEYKDFVDQFPRFVSRIHSQCEDHEDRKLLIMNLLEEEGYPTGDDHPTLWRKFAHGIGTSSEVFEAGPKADAARALVKLYWEKCNSSYEEGLAALYAYEHQIPSVSKAKIEGLKKNYDLTSKDCTGFFDVHEEADKYHSEACAKLMDKIPLDKQEKTLKAAKECSEAIWNFLSSCEPKACALPA